MTGLELALAGGAIGSLITLGATQISKLLDARSAVRLHDLEIQELNEQLLIWVDDETHRLLREMQRSREEFSGRGMHASGHQKAALAELKAGALQRALPRPRMGSQAGYRSAS